MNSENHTSTDETEAIVPLQEETDMPNPFTHLNESQGPSSLLRQRAGTAAKISAAIALGMSTIGSTFEKAWGAEPGTRSVVSSPINAFAANTAGVESVDMPSSAPPLTEEEMNERTEKSRMFYQNLFKNEIKKIKESSGPSQIMQARALMPRLLMEMSKATDDSQRIAIHEVIFEYATIGGGYREALVSHQILTPENELFTPAFFEKEKTILDTAKTNSANANVVVQNKINAELSKRKGIAEALAILAQNPEDAERNQQVGEYMFFTQHSLKGLIYLAKGTNPLHRMLASKMDDAVFWWSESYNETDIERQKEMRRYALSKYQSNPGKYSEKERGIFEGLLKTHAILAKEASQRVTIASASGAPEIKQATEQADISVDVQKSEWINILQFANPAANSKILPNGRGGLVFKGKDEGNKILDFPLHIDGEYDLALEFVDGTGTGAIVFIIPVGESQCMIMKGADYIGIDTIDNVRASTNKTKKPFTFKPGVMRKMLVRVRNDEVKHTSSVKIYLDDNMDNTIDEKDLVTEYDGDPGSIIITDMWKRAPHRLAIGGNKSDFEIQKALLSKKSGAIKPVQN